MELAFQGSYFFDYHIFRSFNNNWFNYFYLVKSTELKKDIEILSQTFERIIDRKDAILKSLVKDLEEAEEQYQTAIKSHLQNLRKLLGISPKFYVVEFYKYINESLYFSIIK